MNVKDGIHIGEDVNISSYSKIITAKHSVENFDFNSIEKSITINYRVWIAARAIILQWITIGKGAVVVAGSVVFKSIEPFTIVEGLPAKKIGERNCNINYRLYSKASLFL